MDTATSTINRPRTRAVRLVPAAMLAAGMAGVVALPAAGATTRHARKATVAKWVTRPKYGKILVDTKGFTLYTFAKDKKNHSNCTGGCIAVWPALLVPAGATPVGTGVSGLGMAKRSNGQQQVTYKGKPLYLFVSDKKAGQVTGQGVNGFSIVKAAASTTATTTAGGGSGYGY
ncbi:MAG TPA: hypothetical protein VMU75_08690 [Acidimicrobiales bacterium]|nr:hypothetical protein [Acidimicrobiales bacterium]